MPTGIDDSNVEETAPSMAVTDNESGNGDSEDDSEDSSEEE